MSMFQDAWYANTCTYGGFITGASIIVFGAVRWWHKDRPKWKPIIAPIVCLLYGVLLVLCAGGLLGGLANVTLWGSNWLGYAALVYGVGGGAPDATRAHDILLSTGGHGVVIMLTSGMVAHWMFAKRRFRLQIALAVVAGISIGLSSGALEYVAPPLVQTVNWAGDQVAGLR